MNTVEMAPVQGHVFPVHFLTLLEQVSSVKVRGTPHTHTVCEPRVLLENLTWAGDESLSLRSCQSSGTEIVKVIVTTDADMGVQSSVRFRGDLSPA